jgi:hypothetical protein
MTHDEAQAVIKKWLDDKATLNEVVKELSAHNWYIDGLEQDNGKIIFILENIDYARPTSRNC